MCPKFGILAFTSGGSRGSKGRGERKRGHRKNKAAVKQRISSGETSMSGIHGAIVQCQVE